MGKKADSKRGKHNEDNDGFGRPKDNDIQVKFMSLIRGTKLQLINAESELQIELAFFDTSQGKRKKRRNGEPQTTQEQITDFKDQIIKRINLLDEKQRIDLMNQYLRIKKSWNFLEVNDPKQFPKYLFDDQNDLSYILFRMNRPKMQKMKDQQKEVQVEINLRQISPEQLLLVDLLCLQMIGDSFQGEY